MVLGLLKKIAAMFVRRAAVFLDFTDGLKDFRGFTLSRVFDQRENCLFDFEG